MTPRVTGGFTSLELGMNNGLSPSLLPPNQCALARDMTMRGGYAATRPPYANWPLSFADPVSQSRFTGKFQGGEYYQSSFGTNQFICSRGGRLFKITLGQTNQISEITPRESVTVTAIFTVPSLNASVNVSVTTSESVNMGDTVIIDNGIYVAITTATALLVLKYTGGAADATVAPGTAVTDGTLNQLFQYEQGDPNADIVYMFTAETYMIILRNQFTTVFYDGVKATLAAANQIPPALYGIYVWGRIWVSLPDGYSFVAGDLVGSSSGSPSLQYVDAILYMTENTILNGGGSFKVPKSSGKITGFSALTTYDTSLGVGNLIVSTKNSFFSVNTPVDRTTWQNLTYPIQTVSLLGDCAEGQRNQIPVNGDIWYRASSSIKSFIVARRDINIWGNTQMSFEISDILANDTSSLLKFGSGVFFDNKLFMTVMPLRMANGIVHQGLAVMDFDAIDTLTSQQENPAWEDISTGLNILQVLGARVSSAERAFAFVLGDDNSTLELWEILPDADTETYDVFTSTSGITTTALQTPIQSVLETRGDNMGDLSQLKKLVTCELFLDQLVDNVSLVIKWKPDQYPVWTTWATVNMCATVSQCTIPGGVCSVWKMNQNQYVARLMLPRPPDAVNVLTNRPMNMGYEFQFRLEGVGNLRIKQFKPHAEVASDKMMGDCPPETVCQTLAACDMPLLGYDSHG